MAIQPWFVPAFTHGDVSPSRQPSAPNSGLFVWLPASHVTGPLPYVWIAACPPSRSVDSTVSAMPYHCVSKTISCGELPHTMQFRNVGWLL